jgi:hypothetical protein
VPTACFYGSLLLATGAFNASQGGEAAFLLAGLGLHFFWLAQMVAAIVHRHRLARIDYALASDAICQRLAELAQSQRRVAQITLWFSPLFVVVLAQVLGKVMLNANLLGALHPTALIALLMIALVGCVALSRRAMQAVLGRFAGWLLLGTGSLAGTLRECVPNDAGRVRTR